MITLNAILIAIIIVFAIIGLMFGFIHTLGSLIGAILGVVISLRIIDPIFDMFGGLLGTSTFAKIAVFAVLFIIISRLVGLLFYFIEKIFHLVPFGKALNKLIGFIFGILEGVVVLGAVLYFASTYIGIASIQEAITNAPLAQQLLSIFGYLKFLIPQDFQLLNQLGGTDELKGMVQEGIDKVKDIEVIKNLTIEGLDRLKDLSNLEQLDALKGYLNL
ncbi:MAG: CvpA family protein [Patescibacteria group bacterium]